MPSNTNRSNVSSVISTEPAQQKVAQLRGVADLKQLGGQHQAHPAAVAHQHGARNDEGDPGVGQPAGAQALAPHQFQSRLALLGGPVAEPDVGRVARDPVPAAGLVLASQVNRFVGVDGRELARLGGLARDEFHAVRPGR